MTRAIESFQNSGGPLNPLTWFHGFAPWQIAFFCSGIFGIVWCLMFYPWFRDEPAEKLTVSAEELQHIESGRGPANVEHKLDGQTWTRLITSSSLWAITIYYVCGGFGWSFFVSWMPRYMKDVQGVSFEKSEWSTAFPLVCGGIACFAGGLLSDALVKRTGRRRFGRAIFPICGCSIAAAAMFAIPFARTSSTAIFWMCVASFAYDFGQGVTWASIVDIGGTVRRHCRRLHQHRVSRKRRSALHWSRIISRFWLGRFVLRLRRIVLAGDGMLAVHQPESRVLRS